MAQNLITTLRFVSDADLVQLLWMVKDDADAARIVHAEIDARSGDCEA